MNAAKQNAAEADSQAEAAGAYELKTKVTIFVKVIFRHCFIFSIQVDVEEVLNPGKCDENGVFIVRNVQNVTIWRATLTIHGEIFNLGDNFVSETEATKVYERVAQKMRKARALKRMTQDIDGTEGTVNADMNKPIYVKVF